MTFSNWYKREFPVWSSCVVGKAECVYLSDNIVGEVEINDDQRRFRFIHDNTGHEHQLSNLERKAVNQAIDDFIARHGVEANTSGEFSIDLSNIEIDYYIKSTLTGGTSEPVPIGNNNALS